MTLRNRATPATVRPKFGITSPIVSVAAPKGDLGNELMALGYIETSPKSYLQERFEALRCALERPCVATHEEAAELVNRSNGAQGTSVQGMHARAASRKAQRAIGGRMARTLVEARPLDSHNAFAVVVLTRIAPRTLDLTNLDHTFKSVIDGIATGLGIDDRSSQVRYVTTQEQGAPRYCAVRAELFIQPKEQP